MTDDARPGNDDPDTGDAAARYRALVEQAPIVVYEWEFGDPGRWRYLSPRIEELLGYPAAELIDNADLWWDRIHEDDRAEVLAGEVESQKAAEGETNEYRMRHRDGHVVWIRDEAIAFTAPEEEGFFRGIVSDITVEKEAQLALATLNVDLERRVALRTAELEIRNRELRTAMDVAERASRARSEFLSRASHELRTPMNAILGFGQLLETADLADKDRNSVDHIMTAGRRLLELINDILDISTVQAGQLTLSIEPVAVAQVVAEAIASERAHAADQGIDLEIDDPGPASFVLADRQRLRQVMTYLLSNAIRFNGSGGSVQITWRADTARTRVRVIDTGQGISPEHLQTLFAVFEPTGAASGSEGFGLGLPLAKALTEAMGGRVSAESTPGRGTTVTVDLATSADPLTTADLPDSSDASRISQAHRTILCIEDNLANIALVQGILEHRPGITLLRAMHGGTGVRLAADHRPDLVLLDLHLPDMSGEEALTRLRADPTTRDIPVLAVSAETDSEAIGRVRALGIQGFVTKPIDVGRFLSEIDAALKSSGERA